MVVFVAARNVGAAERERVWSSGLSVRATREGPEETLLVILIGLS